MCGCGCVCETLYDCVCECVTVCAFFVWKEYIIWLKDKAWWCYNCEITPQSTFGSVSRNNAYGSGQTNWHLYD